jgi:acyl-CoA thioesterase II
VDCIRDGKSFTTRSVIAIQNGRAILNMAASFQVAETGFDHQDAAPQPAGPEGITSERELALMVADQIPESIREKILCKKAIEIRPVDPINPFAPEKRKPLRYAWFKAVGRLPDDPMVHQYMLAYASDFGLAITSLYPHGQMAAADAGGQPGSCDVVPQGFPHGQLASLCHGEPQCREIQGIEQGSDLHSGRETSGLGRPGRVDPFS